ncbi:YteA family regulatory protein [Chryseomicrobium aureum]|uniref:TraR/DksA C4-type zinc finger protein n=1 Tax=Chryseomicrobium aureum TaxID=1441723 RepID=UPI00195DC595|nr:TraR/DksA C4-type zinc finger protein [Chryseomicrobium aureum]MBM7706474.1 YteA family regulatory protein [Chryseomicrobium aureum]
MKYEKLKKQLLERKHELEEHEKTQEDLESTELSNYDNHPADNATDLTDQHTQQALDRHEEEELESIDVALQAMDEGTYGTCAVCGKEIPIERLEIVPTALTCVDHADQSPKDHRPIEEKILDAAAEREDMDNSFEDVEDFGSSDSPADKA